MTLYIDANQLLLFACAIPEQFDQPLLACLLDDPALAAHVFTNPADFPLIHPAQTPAYYQLESTVRAQLLEQLEETTIELAATLHLRAVSYYHVQLQQQAQPRLEQSLMEAIEWLFYYLINSNQSQQLDELLQAVADTPWQAVEHRFTMDYYLACLRNEQGDYQAAERIFLALQANSALNPLLAARVFTASGLSYDLQGRFDRAIQSYETAVIKFQALANLNGESKAVNNLGIIYHQLGDYPKAKVQFERALQLARAGKNSESEGRALLELGYTAKELGEWEEAHRAYNDALTIFTNQGKLALQGKIQNNLGELYFLQHQPAAAAAAYQDALTLFRSPTLAATERDQADVQCNLALLHLSQQQFAIAADHLTQARALIAASKVPDQLLACRILYLQSRLDWHQQASNEVIEARLTAALEQSEALSRDQQDPAVRRQLRAMLQHIYDTMILFLIDQRQDWAAAFEWVERARARVFLDELVHQRTTPTTEGLPTAMVATQQPLTLAAIRAQLPADSALIAYYLTGRAGPAEQMFDHLPAEAKHLRSFYLPPERLLAFVVTQEQIQLQPLANTVHQHRERFFYREGAQRLRGTITPKPGERLSSLQRWQTLHDELVAPLLPAIGEKARLIIVPHSTLHYLPLHALAQAPAERLAERFTVSYAPSASVLAKLGLAPAAPPPAKPSALVVGVDDGNLPHAPAEARTVAAQLQQAAYAVTCLLNAAATVEQVRAELASRQVIHLACHGHFAPGNPMHSSLHLANGALRAADLLGIPLKAALVVLSACDTALNQLEHGDELVGLTRAWLGAGAQALIVALWPVLDLSTRLLMDAFYHHWLAQQAVPAALRQAQQTLQTMTTAQLRIRLTNLGLSPLEIEDAISRLQVMSPQTDFLLAHPYFWAAFTVIGKSR